MISTRLPVTCSPTVFAAAGSGTVLVVVVVVGTRDGRDVPVADVAVADVEVAASPVASASSPLGLVVERPVVTTARPPPDAAGAGRIPTPPTVEGVMVPVPDPGGVPAAADPHAATGSARSRAA